MWDTWQGPVVRNKIKLSSEFHFCDCFTARDDLSLFAPCFVSFCSFVMWTCFHVFCLLLYQKYHSVSMFIMCFWFFTLVQRFMSLFFLSIFLLNWPHTCNSWGCLNPPSIVKHLMWHCPPIKRTQTNSCAMSLLNCFFSFWWRCFWDLWRHPSLLWSAVSLWQASVVKGGVSPPAVVLLWALGTCHLKQ